MKVGVDDDLDIMRHRYDGLDSLLSEVRKKLLESSPLETDPGLNVIYFPQIGFLIVLPLDIESGQGAREADIDPEGLWVRMFSTDAEAYYKSNEMREMDEHFGDIYGMICGQG